MYRQAENMTLKNLFGFLVASLALVLMSAGSAHAFGDITAVEVNGVDALAGGVTFANFAGQRIPVLVVFKASGNAEDVRVKAWISGERENSVVSERFDVIAGKTYTRVVSLGMPFDLDERLDDDRKLEIVVESKRDGTADEKTIDFSVQRESYLVEILSATMDPKVAAGEPLVVDVVLKNRGRHFAEDTFLVVRIPELDLETRAYFGDLSPVDQGGNVPDKEDAVERRMYLRIPSDAPAGIYDVELEAFNEDAVATLQKRVMIRGSEAETLVLAPIASRTFRVGDMGEFTLTVVNKGNTIGVYELLVKAPSELSVVLDEPVVVVPAGSSRTVMVEASSPEIGTYSFSIDVTSDGKILSTKSYTAKVQDAKSVAGVSGPSGVMNTTLLLTVILAIIFVVLLVVLIVLLTRKPEKSEEFSESYY